MLRLSAKAKVLEEAAKKLGYTGPLDLVEHLILSDAVSEDSLDEVLGDGELADAVRTARRRLRETAETTALGDMLVAYLLHTDGAPRSLIADLVSRVPGIYWVNGEPVLLTGEPVQGEVKIDRGYMRKLLDAYTRFEPPSIVQVAGVALSGGTYSLNHLLGLLLDQRVAEEMLRYHAEKAGLVGVDVSRDQSAVMVSGRTRLVVEVGGEQVPVDVLLECRVLVDSDGVLYSEQRVEYRDDVATVPYTRRIAGYSGNWAQEVLKSFEGEHRATLARYIELRRLLESSAEQGFTLAKGEGALRAERSLQLSGATVTVTAELRVTAPEPPVTSVIVRVSPPRHRVEEIVAEVVKRFGGEETGPGEYAIPLRESIHVGRVISLARAILREVEERARSEEPAVSLEALVRAALLYSQHAISLEEVEEVAGVPAEAVFVRLAEELEKRGIPGLARGSLVHGAEIRSGGATWRVDAIAGALHTVVTMLARTLEVDENGDLWVLGVNVDDALWDHPAAAVSAKRELVHEALKLRRGHVREPSLTAEYMVKYGGITPSVVKKLAACGDWIPLEILALEHGGAPMWRHLSEHEKFQVMVRYLTLGFKGIAFRELLSSGLLEPDDWKIAAVAACYAEHEDCTKLAYLHLQRELSIPKHAKLVESESGATRVCYVDVGRFTVSIEGYQPRSGFKFKVHSRATGSRHEIWARTMSEALSRAYESDEKTAEASTA
ncbi:MAG: hypothetical protein QW324_07215 [Thermofilaceae archaeon]